MAAFKRTEILIVGDGLSDMDGYGPGYGGGRWTASWTRALKGVIDPKKAQKQTKNIKNTNSSICLRGEKTEVVLNWRNRGKRRPPAKRYFTNRLRPKRPPSQKWW